MQLPDLTQDQQKLIGQYWNYDETNGTELPDFILNKINVYLNNIMIEQTNRNALASVPTPALLTVQEPAPVNDPVPETTQTDSAPVDAAPADTVTSEEVQSGFTESN